MENQEIKKEMMEIITKNLPSQTADSLKEYIAEAQRTQIKVNELTLLNKQLSENFEKKTKELQSANMFLDLKEKSIKNWIKRESELIARENIVLDREVRISVIDTKLEAEKEKVQLVKDLAHAAFRNPMFIHHEEKVIPFKTECISSHWDSAKGRNIYEKSGEFIEKVEVSKTTTKTQE